MVLYLSKDGRTQNKFSHLLGSGLVSNNTGTRQEGGGPEEGASLKKDFQDFKTGDQLSLEEAITR